MNEADFFSLPDPEKAQMRLRSWDERAVEVAEVSWPQRRKLAFPFDDLNMFIYDETDQKKESVGTWKAQRKHECLNMMLIRCFRKKLR